MLREAVGENTRVYFCGMECKVLEVLSDSRVKLTIPVVDGQLQLIPLYTQGSCWFADGKQVFRAKAEVLERYKSENRYAMELELKEGLYRIPVRTRAGWQCREEGVLSIGEDPKEHLTVEVQGIWPDKLQFVLMQGQTLTDMQLEEGKEAAQITLWQMKLPGRLLTAGEGKNNEGYTLQFADMPWEIRKKITETALSEGKNMQNFGKK